MTWAPRWALCGLAVLVVGAPAVAQDETASDIGAGNVERVTAAGRFRDWRGNVGTRFEESDVGAYVNEHVTAAVEYRFYQFLDTGPPHDSRRTRHEGRLELEYETTLMDDVELYVSTRVWVDDDDYATGTLDSLEDDAPKRHIFDVPETYVDLFFDDVDLRLGKQVVKWGKADVFNPTDQINPDDFSTLLDDEPIGVVAGKLNYYYEDWGLELVVVPTFTPSRFPPRGTRFDLLPQAMVPPLLEAKERPDTIHDVQYGVRVNTTVEGWDFSASWYDGVNHFPGAVLSGTVVFPFGPLVPVPIPAIQPVYNRFRLVGGDFATTFDRLGLHGEGAWYRTDGHRDDEYLQYVIGIDYTLTDVFRDHDIFAILEYAGEHVITQQRKGIGAGALQRAFANTFAMNVDYEVSEFLTLTLRGIYNFDRQDNFLLEPQVEYEVNDHLVVTAGFDIIHGTGGATLFELLSQNDQFYCKGRYTF